jgi:hypothetical protein
MMARRFSSLFKVVDGGCRRRNGLASDFLATLWQKPHLGMSQTALPRCLRTRVG